MHQPHVRQTSTARPDRPVNDGVDELQLVHESGLRALLGNGCRGERLVNKGGNALPVEGDLLVRKIAALPLGLSGSSNRSTKRNVMIGHRFSPGNTVNASTNALQNSPR